MTITNVEVINDVTEVTVTQAPTVTFQVTQASPINVELATAGLQGPAGGAWFNGTAPPSAALGANGDYYVVTSGGTGLGDVYRKNASNVWVLQGNIRGAAGNVTATGTLVPGNIISVNNVSGIIQDAGIPATDIVRISGAQTITGSKTFTGANQTFTGNIVLTGNLISAAGTPLITASAITVGSNLGDFVITREHDHTGAVNTLKHVTFVSRNTAAGADWTSADSIEGIAVDASFVTPATAKTWWRRSPSAGTQGWGNAGTERLTINSTGVIVTGTLNASGIITGNGSGLTALVATNVTSGTLPDAQLPTRLGISAKVVTDWNTATEDGWYKALNATNQPDVDASARYFVEVISHDGTANLVLQKAYKYVGTGTGINTLVAYQRWYTGSTWGAWQRMRITDDTLDARYVSLTTSQSISGNKTFVNGTTFSGTITNTGGSVEIGRTDGTASTPFIDFHSGATAVDYDSRIVASGGTGTSGQGALAITATAGISFTGNVTPSSSTYTLGASGGTRWGNLYSAGVDVSGGSPRIALTHTGSVADGLVLNSTTASTASPRLFFQNDTGISGLFRSSAGNFVITSGAVIGTGSGTVLLTITDAGATTFLSTVAAGGTGFSGGGSGLTSLNGTNISSGTVADARLSSNVVLLTGTQTLTGAKTFSSVIAASAGITIPGTQTILMSAAGVGAPTFTTRSAGTKFVAYDFIGASSVDYALGIATGEFWSSVPDNTRNFRWYAGTTGIATLSGTGGLTLTGGLVAGTGVSGLSATFTGTITGGAINGPGALTNVKVMTQANDTLSGLAARDGYTPSAGDYILVATQTTSQNNGVYVAASGAWSRASNFSSTQQMSGVSFYVERGTNAGKLFKSSLQVGNTLGTTPFLFIPVYDGQWRGVANGIAGLNASSRVDTVNLGSGTADATAYLRGDSSWVQGGLVPSGGATGDRLVKTSGTNYATSWSTPTEGVWITFSPATPNVFTTTLYAKYMRIGNTITVKHSFLVATGGVIGQILINLPFPFAADAHIYGTNKIGDARAVRQGVAYYEGSITPNQLSGPSRAIIAGQTGTGGTPWDASYPAAWQVGDAMTLNYTYECAP